MKPIGAFRLPVFFPPMVGLSLLACHPAENEQVACLPSDQECIEESSPGGAEAILADAGENSGDGAGAADSARSKPAADDEFWSLKAGGTRVEGTIGLVGRRDGRFAVQLVSDDAVNLWLVLPDDGKAVRQAETVLLAFGRGNRCRYDSEDTAPFTVRLDQTEAPWVSGQFDGPVQCEGEATSTRASGTFRVSNSR